MVGGGGLVLGVTTLCHTSPLSTVCVLLPPQSQYVFIHDALNELITCGDTHVEGSELRTRINELHRVPHGTTRSGFVEQFEVMIA